MTYRSGEKVNVNNIPGIIIDGSRMMPGNIISYLIQMDNGNRIIVGEKDVSRK